MFTGIIEAVGSIGSMQEKGSDMSLFVQTGKLDMSDVQLGDSIAVSGVCLTVIEFDDKGFRADVSGETLRRTIIGKLSTGDEVNLEKALTPTTRLGGHLVSGHVDGVGKVVERTDDGRSIVFRIKAPAELAKYIAEKGSICVDGISLTVNAVDGAVFDLNIVPHTLQETTMSGFEPGRSVNLEVDVIARYLERMLLGEKAADSGQGITLETLAQHGYLNK